MGAQTLVQARWLLLVAALLVLARLFLASTHVSDSASAQRSHGAALRGADSLVRGPRDPDWSAAEVLRKLLHVCAGPSWVL
jgi:hypothetical protein